MDAINKPRRLEADPVIKILGIRRIEEIKFNLDFMKYKFKTVIKEIIFI